MLEYISKGNRTKAKQGFYKNPKRIKKWSETAYKTNEKLYGKYIEEIVNCYNCHKPIIIKYRENRKKEKYFCCRSCANKRVHSELTKVKIGRATSISIKRKWANDSEYAQKCINNLINNKRFTSKRDCYRKIRIDHRKEDPLP